jgi:hypothetical protein
MSHRIFALSTTLALGVLVFLSPGKATAQQKDLPPAKEIWEKFIKVTGGREAYAKIRNMVTEGTIEVTGVGVSGTIQIWEEGNKHLMEVNIGGAGKIVEGTDGKNAWSMAAIFGNRLKKGKELEETLFESELHGDVNWEKRYQKVECVGVADVEGKPAYKVVCTPEKLNPRTMYFDKESGLLVRMDTKQTTPMADVDAEIILSDYRKVDGVLKPFKSRVKAGPQEMIMTVKKVECNVQIPPERFAMPPEIKELLK